MKKPPKPTTKTAPSYPVPHGTRAQPGGKMVGPKHTRKPTQKGR